MVCVGQQDKHWKLKWSKMKLQLGKNSGIPHCPGIKNSHTTTQNYQYRIGLILRLGGEWKKKKKKKNKRKGNHIYFNIF